MAFERYVTELFIMLVTATVFTASVLYYFNGTKDLSTKYNSEIIANSFDDAIKFLWSSYDGASYIIPNPDRTFCWVSVGEENTTLYQNVPYIQLNCPGNVVKRYYWVKLSTDSITRLDSNFIYIYRVSYDGQNMTVYIRT